MLYVIIAILAIILIVRGIIDAKIFRTQVGAAAVLAFLERDKATLGEICAALQSISSSAVYTPSVEGMLGKLVAEKVLSSVQIGAVTYYRAPQPKTP